MQRKIKNIIMVCLVVLLACANYFTFDYAKNNISNTNVVQNNVMPDMGNPPEKPNEENTTDSTNETKKHQRPTKASDESTESATTTEHKKKSTTEETQVDNETSKETQNDSETTNHTPPTKPDNMTQNNIENSSQTSDDSNLLYYGLFVVEDLCLSIIILYLVLSQFNKKTLKETFISKDKLLIYVLSIIILTCALTTFNIFAINYLI